MSKSNIIEFPGIRRDPGLQQSFDKAKMLSGKSVDSKNKKRFRALWSLSVRCIWVVVVLMWPILKWIVSIDVFFQGIKALYFWHDPSIHAGWIFVAHFLVLTTITYFVSVFRPKGL